MKHITVDEIIEFISFDAMDAHALKHASKVTSHIRVCGKCMRNVRAFQIVYDELVKLGQQSRFQSDAPTLAKQYASEDLSLEMTDDGFSDAD